LPEWAPHDPTRPTVEAPLPSGATSLVATPSEATTTPMPNAGDAALVVLAGGVLAGVATWVIIKRRSGARRA
jgi:hypothetical protein